MPVRFVVLLLAVLSLATTASARRPRPRPAKPAAPTTHRRGDVDDGPDILVHPVLSARLERGIVIDAEIRDRHGVFEPKLCFRAIGEARFNSIAMADKGSDLYRGEIPGTSVTGPMEFYVEAFDKLGNGPARSSPPLRPQAVFLDKADAPDARAPEVVHTPVERATMGASIPIEASFRGPSGVFQPTLYYRLVGGGDFLALGMAELPVAPGATKPAGLITGPGGSGRFVAEIPGALVTDDVEYYLEAMDTQGNPAHDGTRERPHVIRVEAAPAALAAAAIDPDLALSACLDLPKPGETADVTRLGSCRAAPDKLPLDAVSKFELGQLKLSYEKIADAEALFLAATQLAPKWPAARFRLGQAAEENKDFATAHDAWVAYLELAGSPPEKAALVRRVARAEDELEREADAAKAAARRAEADRLSAVAAAREAEAAKKREHERVVREMLWSSPESFGLAAGTYERLSGARADETLAAMTLRLRLKVEAAPMLFFGLALTAGLVSSRTDAARTNDVVALAPVVGLNLLALPSPRASHFTLLSPFVAFEPRFVVRGALESLGGGFFESRVSLGNHFEFGRYTLEVAYLAGVGQAVKSSGFELAFGRRFGAEDDAR